MLKKSLGITLKVLVSGALIWYLLGNIDVESAQARLLKADPTLLMAGISLFTIQWLLGGLRWRAVSIAIKAALPLRDTLRMFYIGMFFNQALPGGTGGDAVRVYLAYKGGLKLRGAINGVMLERVTTVVALVLMVDVAQPFFQARIESVAAEWVLSSAIFLTLGAVGGLAMIMIVDRFFQNFDKWKIVRGLSYLSADTRLVFLNPKNLFTVIVWGLLTHINLSVCIYILALSLDLQVSLSDCLMLVPPVLLITAIPISIGGWGIRETAMVSAFALVGVPDEGALVLSLLVGFVGLAISLPGGLVWLFSRERGQGANLDDMETELATEDASGR